MKAFVWWSQFTETVAIAESADLARKQLQEIYGPEAFKEEPTEVRDLPLCLVATTPVQWFNLTPEVREPRKIIEIKKIKMHVKRRPGQPKEIRRLAESIEDRGLLTPILLTPDNCLVDGLLRIEAFKLLGRTEIEYEVSR